MAIKMVSTTAQQYWQDELETCSHQFASAAACNGKPALVKIANTRVPCKLVEDIDPAIYNLLYPVYLSLHVLRIPR